MEISNGIIEKYFRNKHSIILTIFITIKLIIRSYLNITLVIPKIIDIICTIGINIYYIIDTIIYNKLPKNKNGDAILVRITSKDKTEYEDIKYKFGNEFEGFIKNDKYNMNILYIPYHLVEFYNYNKKEKMFKLLQKTNCIFLIDIRITSEEIKQSIKYIVKFNLGIIHPTYSNIIEKILQNEFSILSMPTSRIEYYKEDKLNTLEFAAKKISTVCKYIIARAYYLNNKLDNALNIAENLFCEVNNIVEEGFENIKNSIRLLCYDIHVNKMLIENNKIKKNIKYIENEIEKANKYIKNTYLYFETKSVCCFLSRKDIKETSDYLGRCKKIDKNGTWRYSIAFLKAYSGESEEKILYHYKQAFKVPYEHIRLIYFIEDVLSKEPEKNMLRFALILLYLKIGDIKIAKEVMDEYIENKIENNIDNNTINKLKEMFGKDIIEKIL